MRSILYTAFSSLICIVGFSQANSQFVEIPIDMTKTSEIKIEAAKLRLIIKDAGAQRTTLKLDTGGSDKDDLIKMEDSKLLITGIKANTAELKLVLSGKLPQLNILTKSLVSSIENADIADLNIVSQSINLKIIATKGSADLKAQTGQLFVEKHQGNWKIDTYSVNTSFVDVEGDISGATFSGQTTYKNTKGNIKIKQNKGRFVVNNHTGNIDVTTLSADGSVASLEGELRGKSGTGDWNLNLEESNRVRLRTDEGKVNVRMPRGSGSHVNIGSNEGDLSYPNYLEMKRYPSIKVATGRLRGRLGGSVFVRTKKGDVVLR